MAQERRVSFVPAAVKWREAEQDGDGLLVLARPQQSVFARLGPKVSVDAACDPPYVPESVGEPPLAGMIFGCSPETYDECIGRQLFGLPVWKHKPQVMRIAPGASIFLFNFKTRCMLGIFEATSHGGVHIVREAFGGQFEAQVKVRLVENCPFLHERDFKDAIRENYTNAIKFNFPLSEAQVCRLKLLFRLKAAEVSALSIDLNHGRRVVQFSPAEPQQARNSVQVQRRVINNFSKDEIEVSTTFVSAPPVLSRVHVSPSHTQSHALGGLEVSICSNEKKDKKRNVACDSPRRHVVMYDTRKEQSSTPILKSKIPRPARQEVVREVFQTRSSRGISQDHKRHADTSPHRVQEYSKEQFLPQELGQEIDEGGSGIECRDLRELLTQKVKKLKPSTKELLKSVGKPMDPPVYTGGNIAIGDVLFIDDSKRNLERVLPPPRANDATITSGSLKAENSKGLVISKTSTEAHSTEARKYGKTIRPVQDVQRKLKATSVSADGRLQFLTTAGSHCAMTNNADGRGILEACGRGNGYNNADKEFTTARGGDVGCCVDLSTNTAVKSVRKLDDKIMEAGPGDQPKDGRLDIYVSLPVEKAENARQSNLPIASENQRAIGHVVSCVLGKRTRGSKRDDTVLDSGLEPQSLRAGTPVKQPIEVSKESPPEDSVSKVLSTTAKVSETLQETEQGDHLPAVTLAENHYLTSEVRARNAASPCMKNLGEEGMRVDHVQSMPTNILPLNDVISIVSTVTPNNTGDMISLDCKRHTTETAKWPSSSVCKLIKIGHNEAGCSYVAPEVLTPTEGSDLREKVLHKDEMPLQSSSHSLVSGKSGNLWNSRTFRYGKTRSSGTLANHGSRISSKSGSDPSSEFEKSDPNAGSIKLGEEIVYSGAEDFDRQPESPSATEASRTSRRLEKQGALLVCELGNPGGLSLDSNVIRVDIEGDFFRKHQPSAAASVVQQYMLPTEIDAPGRPDSFQTTHAAVVSRSDGLGSSEVRKEIANMKGLTQGESEAADQICYPDNLLSLESVQPTIGASNGGTTHPSILSRKEPMPLKTEPVPRRADAPEDARDLVVEDWLYARNRGSPSACTSAASLSDCSCPAGEPELEINIPIKEEALEICLPIEDDEEVNVGPKSHTRRLCGSSNTDMKPWELIQKNPLHNA